MEATLQEAHRLAIPAVVAHGGAGAGPERLANVERAVAIAAGILDSGGSALSLIHI